MATVARPKEDVQLFKEGDVIVNSRNDKKYIVKKYLGKGGFAKCYEAEEEATKTRIAIKVMPKSHFRKKENRLKLNFEIRVHNAMAHPNIVRFLSCSETSQFVFIYMELCEQHTLMECLKARKVLTEPEVRYWLYQIVSAVEYMHNKLVIHRDLKLANVFISKMRAKVGDFGLCTQLTEKNQKKISVCGTPNYIAPEVLAARGIPKDKATEQDIDRVGHSFEVDIWSIGVIMYTMLYGRPPFETGNADETYKRICDVNYCFPPNRVSTVSEEAQDLIRHILVKDPHLRPTPAEILRFPFFANHAIPQTLPQELLFRPPVESLSPKKNPQVEITTYSISEANPNNQVQKLYKKDSSKQKTSKQQLQVPEQVLDEKVSNISLYPERANETIFEPDKFFSLAPLDTDEPYLLRLLNSFSAYFGQEVGQLPEREFAYSVLVAPEQYYPSHPATEHTQIINFLDASDRYGIGVLFSDGTVCSYYNDLTIMSCKHSRVMYFSMCSAPVMLKYGSSNPTHDIDKKLKILTQFRKQLFELSKTSFIGQKEGEHISNEIIDEWSAESDYPPTTQLTPNDVKAILRWRKGNGFYVFLTSEGLIQYAFLENNVQTVLLSLQTRTVYYVKNGNIFINCSVHNIRRAVGALTRLVQPDTLRRLARCADTLLALAEDTDDSVDETNNEVLERVIRYVTNLEKFIREAKELRTK